MADCISNHSVSSLFLVAAQVQEWHSPPLPGAGQFALPKVPRSGAQIAPAPQWTPRGSRATEDHYDDDSDLNFFRDPQRPPEQPSETSRGHQAPHEEPPETPESFDAPDEGLGAATVSLEASLEVHEAVGGCCRLLMGPFGARRTCYHCRPQVKRCLAVASLRQHSCHPNASSSSSCCGRWRSPHLPQRHLSSFSSCARWRMSHLPHKASSSSSSPSSSSLPPASSSHTRRKSISLHPRPPHTPDLPRSFSSLLRRGLTARRDTLPPRCYERVLWRLTPALWRRLELCLLQLGDTDTHSILTPVMYSLRRLQGMPSKRLVYSPSGDSYGDAEREREDLVCAVCICCVALFVCRLWEGLYGLLAEVLGWWLC